MKTKRMGPYDGLRMRHDEDFQFFMEANAHNLPACVQKDMQMAEVLSGGQNLYPQLLAEDYRAMAADVWEGGARMQEGLLTGDVQEQYEGYQQFIPSHEKINADYEAFRQVYDRDRAQYQPRSEELWETPSYETEEDPSEALWEDVSVAQQTAQDASAALWQDARPEQSAAESQEQSYSNDVSM